jgi:hypothetical protein
MTHLDPDVLAEFRAGLITGRRGARITAHLAGCDRCAALDAQLAEVSALLAAVPVPAVPDSLAQRLDTVLAAEVARKDHPERTVVRGPRKPGSHERPARNQGFRLARLRVLAPAAVAAALVAAGGYGLSRIGSSPAMQAASGSAGRAASSAGGAAEPLAGQPGAKTRMMSPDGFTVVTTGTNYKRGTLQRQLKAEMPASASRPAQAPSGPIVACVHHVTNGVNPVFVDSASFEGHPATIIVVRASKGEKAWVAGASCSATNRDVLAATTLP